MVKVPLLWLCQTNEAKGKYVHFVILQTLFSSRLTFGGGGGEKKVFSAEARGPCREPKQFIVSGHMNRGVSSPGHGHQSQST